MTTFRALRLPAGLAAACLLIATAAAPDLSASERAKSRGEGERPSRGTAVRTAQPSGGGTRTAVPRSAESRPGAVRSAPEGRQSASGRTTYGYGGRGFYAPRYWWYDPYWSWSIRWGWWGGWWGWPYDLWWYPGVYGPAPSVYRYAEPASPDQPARVETAIQPRRATVRVNGEEVGEARDFSGTWDALFLTPGDQTLEFTAPGYKILRIALRVEPGAGYRLEYRLERGDGIDPRSVEAAPKPAVPAQIPRERAREEPPPAVPPSEGLRRGFLRFDVLPADAAVYLDGEYLARADELVRLRGALPVAEGEHLVEIVRPGYKSYAETVTVRAGEPLRVVVSLER
jgi:hypothetical protein